MICACFDSIQYWFVQIRIPSMHEHEAVEQIGEVSGHIHGFGCVLASQDLQQLWHIRNNLGKKLNFISLK